jgi:hypothetical protein
MPERTTTYTENGLTYQIRVYEENGSIFAEITVLEGHMDVNAVYYGDDDFSGSSVNLGGPLNMNGAGSTLDGEPVQWDDATAVSDPGLGSEGTDKPSYLTEGESLIVQLDAESLDDIDIIGIRATSTSTPEGSIKGVSELEEEDNGGGEDDPTYDKLFFVVGTGENEWGPFEFGVSIFAEDNGSTSPNDAFLPPGSDGTLQDYVDAFLDLAETQDDWPQPADIQTIKVYTIGEDGELILVAELDPDVLTGAPLPEIPVENEDEVIDDSTEEEETEAQVA